MSERFIAGVLLSSELAELYVREKRWDEALAAFDASAKVAEESVQAESKDVELGRALRGKGFVLVELGRLERAEAIYRKCLEIDPPIRKQRTNCATCSCAANTSNPDGATPDTNFK